MSPAAHGPGSGTPSGVNVTVSRSEWREGLPRPPEPFHRMYSPPEAPSSRFRGSAVAGVVAAVFAATTAAATTVVLATGPDTPEPDRAPLQAMARPSSGPAVSATFTSVPTACAVLPPGAVRRLVPTPTPGIDRMGTEATSVCRYSLRQDGHYRSVLVDSRAFLPRYLNDAAIAVTAWSFEAQWRQAEKDLTPDTSSLRRLGGLGDAAFERYWIDRGAHVAVGEATVRYRNILLRMQYAEEQPAASDRAASERRCLAAAISAARTGLTAYGR
jgi:hypothetical protein